MADKNKSLSKFLAVILRHEPEKFGLALDEQGYASLDAVWDVIVARYGERYSQDDLASVVSGDARGKKRYEIVGKQIRAMYGHSKPKVIYPVVIPPATLFHGTNPTAYEQIREEGLQAQGRQYVHMTTHLDNAIVVAKRQTPTPIILIVDAQQAHADGIVFHQPEDAHFLARAIPAKYVQVRE
ncbi:MAG: RNA 2'-phosphotransferase [Chloroflexota bacterium]